MLRKIAIAAWILLLSGCSAAQPASTTQTLSQPPSAASTPASTALDVRDRADPNVSGCSPSAVDMPSGRVEVKLPNEQKYGTLLLRRSTACNTIWARVEEITTPNVLLRLRLWRTGDAKEIKFETRDATPDKAAFTNMLVATPGCLKAIASVEGGPEVQTGCS